MPRLPAFLALLALAGSARAGEIVVLVSADAEWKIVREQNPAVAVSTSPFGEWFSRDLSVGSRRRRVFLFHGGWGKIRAAASTQYAIDRWKPELLINLGTCGGFKGAIARGEVILVERTIVYDIVEQMGESDEAIRDYTTDLDVSWTGRDYPGGVRRGLLLSADRDILPADVPRLARTYGAVAADWESGGIAYVAHANRTPVLILRGVSDLVAEEGGEVYGDPAAFEAGARTVMKHLLDQLPFWLARWEERRKP